MKNLKLTKSLALLLSGLMIASTVSVSAGAVDAEADAATGGESSSVVEQDASEIAELMNARKYVEYRRDYEAASKGSASVTISALDYDAEKTDADVKVETVGGKEALFTPDTGTVVYNVDIPSDGLYSISMEYYQYVNGRISNIERALRIDGEIPFKESRYLSMTKIWKNDLTDIGDSDTCFEQDPNGNDVRPSMYEDPAWSTYEFKDSTGYYLEPFQYYLTEGTHTISLEATRESIYIGEITIEPYTLPASYADVSSQYEAKGYKAVSSDATLVIQAETPVATSTKTVYPTYDRSSAITVPQNASNIRLNTIGKTTTWQTVGDWVEYTVTPTETGLYYIVPRFKQSEQVDMFVSRSLTINGELPFAEAANLRFNYSDQFQTEPLNDGENNFQFYFEAGKEYTLRFEVVLGDMSELISQIESSLTNLNNIYLKIKQITGATPDAYRDYGFMDLIPDEMNLLVAEARNLENFSQRLEELTGERGSTCATLNNIARIAKKMGLNEDEVAKNLSTYKSNTGTLGTWMNTARNQPVEIDSFTLQSPEEKMPKANANAFQSLWFELQQFVASFYTDYNSLGSEDAGDRESIEVWVTTGRDQSQIMRNMVNDDFTPNYDVYVNLKLVAGGTLLPATLAGQGPDIANMGGSDPVNYAIRSAIQNLDKFDTYDEVVSRFSPEAIVPFQLENPDTGVLETFAIPETQNFNMLFYRQDVFAELGLDVPTTWQELKNIVPVLQSKYMEVGVPKSLAGFMTLFYQRGGDLYADNGMRINLDSNLALDTFKELCDMFTQYKFPLSYDFANRFRTGEMPIGIADYSTYTMLNAFATEIRGMWAMTTIPGYEVDDGNGGTYINNTSTTGSSGLVMMAAAKNPTGAWKYIDWLTSADAQATYGNEYTALLGNGTIHPTANIEAMKNMNWSTAELETLLAQFTNLKATPEYPGSYIVTRYVDFAFMDAYNNNADPVDSLLSEYIYINKELTRKRKEFGLDTLELGETLADREAAKESGTADAE